VTLTRREPPRRRTRLERRTPLRSSRRSPVTPETRRLVYRRAGRRCEIGMTCGGRLLPPTGWDPSHRQRRAEGRHGPENILVACRRCHDWLPTAPRRWVETCGWLLPFACTDPGGQPVLLRGRQWVFLTAAGGYRKADDDA
jgi:hypothetical protein